MKPAEAPRGTLATLGHPDNRIYIVKGRDWDKERDHWRYADTGEIVDPEDFRGGWDALYVPEA